MDLYPCKSGALASLTKIASEDLGPAPQWVDDIIEADEDWQSDLLANDGPDPDRAYDERRDLQLTER
jgi:hypothetical protein